MRIIKTIGNQDLLQKEKTLFLCSKRTPIGLYEYVFRWTDSLTEQDCIACFNTTEMEKEVLKALLVARVPTVLFVMNRFTDVNNVQIERALHENRLLMVVLRRDEPMGKGVTPRLRNEYVLSLCQHVTCGYVNKNGSVFPLLAGRQDMEYLMDERLSTKAAEANAVYERWTVAQDKVLLRMFYSDMGIHAIHKALHRTYPAIYSRLRSITQPEDMLKGREFEDFVLSLFNVQEGGKLVLQEWQGDKSLGKVQPENNSHPDFVFRYGEEEFAVECKWRERLKLDMDKDVFSTKRMRNYRNFSETRRMPVTVILGIGGEPCNPEWLYKIPLEDIDSILSGKRLLSEFLHPLCPFVVSAFLQGKDVQIGKAYTMAEKRTQHANAYKPWSADDDCQLMILYHENRSIAELSSIFMRNEGAIRSRINKLMGENEGN